MVLYAVTAVYFAGVMVRLMLTLTPVVCILAAIAFSVTLDNYLVDDRPAPSKELQGQANGHRDSSDEEDRKKRKDLYDKVQLGLIFKCAHEVECEELLNSKLLCQLIHFHHSKLIAIKYVYLL